MNFKQEMPNPNNTTTTMMYLKDSDPKEKDIQEILNILQEECAEVIQAVSKIRRFGINSKGPNGDYKYNNLEQLEVELGDLMQMVHLLYENGYIEEENVMGHAEAKREKLRRWSIIDIPESVPKKIFE